RSSDLPGQHQVVTDALRYKNPVHVMFWPTMPVARARTVFPETSIVTVQPTSAASVSSAPRVTTVPAPTAESVPATRFALKRRMNRAESPAAVHAWKRTVNATLELSIAFRASDELDRS